jgi:hypothetical protein
VIAALWNHVQLTEQRWPTLRERDVADLAAFFKMLAGNRQ